MHQFTSWAAVIAAAQQGERLWYHAPMDLHACMVLKTRVFKNGKLLRVTAGACTFTADAGHLGRFRYRGDAIPGAWKLIPETIFCTDETARKQGKLLGGNVPVLRVTTRPPVTTPTHEGTGIKGECVLVEVTTPIGVRHYGVADAYINSSLRMAVKLWPGCERDEVIRRWEDTTDERGSR